MFDRFFVLALANPPKVLTTCCKFDFFKRMGNSLSAPISRAIVKLSENKDVSEEDLNDLLPISEIPITEIFSILTPDVIRDLLADQPRNLAKLTLKVGLVKILKTYIQSIY